MKVFNVSVDNSNRLNQTTYPARNYCIITQQSPTNGPHAAVPTADDAGEDDASHPNPNEGKPDTVNSDGGGKDAEPVIRGKKVRGTAVDPDLDMRQVKEGQGIALGSDSTGSLSISLQIEVDHKNMEGHTKSYAFSIPTLQK